MNQIQVALNNVNSLLRSGSSGFLLDGASLEILGTVSEEPRRSPRILPTNSPLNFPQAAPVVQEEPPIMRDTTGDLLARITELLETIEKMKSDKDKLETEKGEILGKFAQSEDLLVAKLKELDELNETLAKTKSNLNYMTEQFEESKRSLVQAKEMWMKESSRATRLREQLDKAEDVIANKDHEIERLNSIMKKNETENHNLKHILSRSTSVVAHPAPEQNFAPSDSYFNLRTTVGMVNPLFTQLDQATGRSTPGAMFTTNLSGSTTPTLSTPAVSHKFLHLCTANDGVLFEDDIIQIGIKAKFTGLGEGVLGVYYGNKTSGILQNLQTKFTDIPLNLHLTSSPVPTQLGPKSQLCQRVSTQISGPFTAPPKLTVSFLLPDNTPRLIPLRIPVTIAKFMQGKSEMSSEEFFSNWRQQLFLLNESSAVVNVIMNLAQIARVATLGTALSLHHQIDEQPDNLVLVGQFPSDSVDGIRCATIPEALALVRIEVGTGQFAGKARIAVRSNDPTVANALKDCLVEQLNKTL